MLMTVNDSGLPDGETKIAVRAHLEARARQDLLRLGRVVRVVVLARGCGVRPAGERRRHDGGLVGRRLVAVLADLRDLVPVDRVRHRLPDGHVVQPGHGQVRDQRHVRDRREPVVVVRALGRVERLDARDELAAPLRLAGGQVRVGRVVGGERRVQHLGDLRLARLPVVRVGDVGDVLRAARLDDERAGRHRVGVGVADRVGDLRPDVLGDDRGLVRDVVEVRHGRGLERHRDLVAALLGDAGQHRPDGVEVEAGVLLHQVEGERHVRRGHRRAVGPLDPVTDGECEGLVVVAPRPGRRQPRGGLAALQGVDERQRLVHLAHGDALGEVRRVERVEAAGPQRALLVGDRQRPARSRWPRWQTILMMRRIRMRRPRRQAVPRPQSR